MSERWDNHFLGMALYHSKLSKDPSTRVGSVIVGPDREILSAGFNGFPRGIADTQERLQDRDTKLKLVVHAEMSASIWQRQTTAASCGADHHAPDALSRSSRWVSARS